MSAQRKHPSLPQMALMALLCLSHFGCSTVEPALYQSWSSSSSRACITINQNGRSFVNELHNVRFKVRGNRLRLVEVYNPRGVFGGRASYWFAIASLTDTSLTLTQDLARNRYYEQLADSVMVFTRTSKEACGHLDPRPATSRTNP